MASAEKLKDDFLSCSICYDIYKTPKCLPCLHTFCLECLSSYIVAEDDVYGVRRKGSFLCPICRGKTTPKHPSKDLRFWANDFQTNFYIQSLMNALKIKGSEQTTDVDFKKLSTSANSLSTFRSAGNLLTGGSDHRSETLTTRAPLATFSSMPDVRTVVNREKVVMTSLPTQHHSKVYSLIKTISGSVVGDRSNAKMNAVCVLNQMVVALDFENSRVKLFFNWRAKLDVNVLTHALNVPTKPKSLTVICDSVFVVNCPSRREMYFVSVVKPRTEEMYVQSRPYLEQISCIRTLKSYKCIIYSGCETLIAVAAEYCRDTGRAVQMDILNYDGIVLRSVHLSDDVSYLDFTHISVDAAGLLYLIDSKYNGLYCLTQEGTELYRYVPNKDGDKFKRLQGVDCKFGDIYLTDFEANSVYEVRNDCGLPASQEVVLSCTDGIHKPTDVYVDDDGTIFVACWDGYIRVYAVQKKQSILKKRVMETDI